MTKSFKPMGILFIAGGVASLVAGVVVRPFLLVGIILAVSFVAVGAVFLYLHPALKDIEMPGGTIAGSMRLMAERTKFAATNLQQMASSSRIAAHGKPVRATINSFRDTGEMISFNPVIEFELTVFPQDGQPPYPATVRQMVSKLTLHRLVAGDQVQAKADPTDPHQLMLAL
jgi:hypothetical protein